MKTEFYWTYPVGVEAVQLTAENLADVIEWVSSDLAHECPSGDGMRLSTVRGPVMVPWGFHVIKHGPRDFRPVEDAILDECYSKEYPG